MATKAREVDLSGIDDWQQPLAFGVGVLLLVVGFAGLTGIFDVTDLWSSEPLVFGVFGVPFWLSITAIVAGFIGILLSLYKGAGTTFNKVAAGLVLPAVILIAITDWTIGVGGAALIVGLVSLILAVVAAFIGVVLLNKRPLALLMPVVAGLAIADWVLGLTPIAQDAAFLGAARVTIPTIGLLILLSISIGVAAFEGGSRMT